MPRKPSRKQAYLDLQYLRERGELNVDIGLMFADILEKIYSGEITVVGAILEEIESYFANGYTLGPRQGEDEEANEWLRADARCLRIKERYYIG